MRDQFPEYDPPVDEIGRQHKENIPWYKSLSIYKYGNPDIRWIYSNIETKTENGLKKIAVVIYDRYPKGTVHLLLLPLINFANSPYEFTKDNLEILKRYHLIANMIANFLKQTYNYNFLIGYHANPSMDDLHIHIVSDDIPKSSKHYNSYHDSKHFLTLEFVESELETHSNLKHLDYVRCRQMQ